MSTKWKEKIKIIDFGYRPFHLARSFIGPRVSQQMTSVLRIKMTKIPVSITRALSWASIYSYKKDMIVGRVKPKELGKTTVRDPDALPPRDILEAIGASLHSLFSGIGGGNIVYAIKAGILTRS